MRVMAVLLEDARMNITKVEVASPVSTVAQWGSEAPMLVLSRLCIASFGQDCGQVLSEGGCQCVQVTPPHACAETDTPSPFWLKASSLDDVVDRPYQL